MICKNCGNEINENQKFCTICGYNLQKHKLFLKGLIILIFSIVFTLFILLFLISFLLQKGYTIDDVASVPINCSEYQNFSYDNIKCDFENIECKYTIEKSASGYLQCTLDKKIKPLNRQYNFNEQEEYWENIYFIVEHSFDNTIKYQNREPKLIGKYNTMDKIELELYKEQILYNLGSIALGLSEYVGPNYMYGEGTWEKYLEVTKSNNENFQKLNIIDQIVIALNIKKLSNKIKQQFYNDYYMNTYIIELLGIEYNVSNSYAKKIIESTILNLYNPEKNKDLDETIRNKINAIIKYNNLKYNKKDFLKSYKKAEKYCYAHQSDKDENGIYINAGTGFIEGCINEYLKQKDTSYSQVCDTIWDYCFEFYQETEGSAGVSTCFINKLGK